MLLIRYVFSLFLGILLSFSYPPIGIFVTWITLSFFCLILYQTKSNYKRALHGFVFGYGLYVSYTYWMPFSIYENPVIPTYSVPILALIIPCVFAIFTAILALLSGLHTKSRILFAIQFSILWCILENVRSNIFFPFNWASIGYSSTSILPFAQILSILGSYLTGLLVLLLSTSIFTGNKYYILTNFFLFMLICFWGENHLKHDKNINNNKTIKIRIVHTKNKIYASTSEILDALYTLTTTKGNEYQDYIIWPESSWPLPIKIEQKQYILSNFLKNKKTILIFGADRIEKEKLFNSIIAMRGDGTIIDFYDKRILVPFGEYIPYSKAISKISNSFEMKDIEKGKKDNILKIDHNILPMICSEIAAGITDLKLYQNYNFIVNISNDAWFSSTMQADQFLNLSRVRAIEYGMPIIRTSNFGASAAINKFGEIIKLSYNNILDISLDEKSTIKTMYFYVAKFEALILSMLYLLFLLINLSKIR